MDAEERREASRAFSDTLRAKWAGSRRGLSAEDLIGRDEGDSTAAEWEDEGEGRG